MDEVHVRCHMIKYNRIDEVVKICYKCKFNISYYRVDHSFNIEKIAKIKNRDTEMLKTRGWLYKDFF